MHLVYHLNLLLLGVGIFSLFQQHSRRDFLRVGIKSSAATAINSKSLVSELVSPSITLEEYKSKLVDLPIANLVHEIGDLMMAFSWDIFESKYQNREKYSNYNQLLVDVRISLIENEKTGIIYPLSYELDNVDYTNLEKAQYLIKQCKMKGGALVKFIKEHSPEEAGSETKEDRGLASILRSAQEGFSDGEIQNINELLDLICCTDFFTQYPVLENMTFDEFGLRFIDSIQESLNYELENDQEINRLIDPLDLDLRESQQEFFKEIFPLARVEKDGSRTWSQQINDHFYASKISAALLSPAQTLALQLNALQMPPLTNCR